MSTTFHQQPTIKQQQALNFLLREAIVEQAAAKIGIFGPQGSGKTTTAALIALGLSKTYHQSAPVAFMDTENGSDYLVPIFEMEGVKLLVIKSRAFKDMKAVAAEAVERGCCAMLVDSYTHPWVELNDSLKEKLNVKKILFEHQDELKSLWRGWTDLMLNSPLHMILAGRLGWVWDRAEDENGNKVKGELIKLGTKMKSENEAGYEPSLLIEMEGLQNSELRLKKSRAKRGTITHYAYVLKDRWRALNGKTFQWPDINEYKLGEWERVFKVFQPHFSKLAIGQQQKAVNPARTSVSLFDPNGQSDYHQRMRRQQITVEEIEGTLRALWSGQDGKSKEMRQAVIENVFGTRSWTAVESKSLEDLEFALDVLRLFEENTEDGHNALTDKQAAVVLLELCKARVHDEAAMEAAAAEQPKSPRQRLDEPEFISPREALLLVTTAERVGWQQSELVSALVTQFSIAGPDFIPVERYTEVLDMIHSGTPAQLARM